MPQDRGSGRFFFQPDHDAYLYYLVLESHVWDEKKDELVLNEQGNPVMTGGWSAVAEAINARFGTSLRPAQCYHRMRVIEKDEEYFDVLFGRAMDFREELNKRGFRGKAAGWFRRTPSRSPIAD